MNYDSLIFRQLQDSDYNKNYLGLLSQLTEIGEITQDAFTDILSKIQSQIWVFEDTTANKIVASASILFEQKIIHGGGIVAHLEDVVVDESYRGIRLGQKLIVNMIDKARENGAYKIIADCKIELLSFYSKNGFQKKGEQIAIYFS
jgi:glucosamine-phosphate N-acetyltransferase